MFDNTVGTLESVPVAIRGYYNEEVRQELTGDMVSEEYTYVDEEGFDQTGWREVPEYEDVTYVVLIPFGETKSWNDVQRVIDANKPNGVIERFIVLAVNGEHKAFHDSYVVWLGNEPQEPVRAHHEDGTFVSDDEETETNEAYENGYTPEMYASDFDSWQEVEPVADINEGKGYKLQVSKKARDIGQYEPIQVHGICFDADTKSYERMVGSLASWDTLVVDTSMIESGLVVEGKMYWTLADNTNVLVSKAELEAVVSSIRIRAGLLHAQYQKEKL